MKRVLIYGFKPFGKYKRNISELVVRKLNLGKEFKIKKAVLPVKFKKDILKKVQKFKPDIIIGLGQKNRVKLLEIERTTRNIYKKDGVKVIVPKRPSRYFLSLKLKDASKEMRNDYISGNYVCNFSRYIIMDFIKKNKLKTKFTFIHIPQNYNPQKASKIIKEIILEIDDIRI